ncbi:hypothetical protein CASFOL_020719 [Castilleja foliolosa]|uniref:Uncharacterized protein n=1 Tax=Castilleja foliolosa TaxID=1961234 RepID=A0ABD3D356_9LAMI
MEILTILATFCLAVSLMLPASASDQINSQKYLKQNGNYAVQQAKFTLHNLLPRKLKLQQEIGTNFVDKNSVPFDKLMKASSDNKKIESDQKEEKLVQTANKSDYMTMDYAWLKRRRPIHNKHVPVNPDP